MMGYRYLDMAAYARRDEYDYFRSLAYPYVGVTIHADITPLHARVRAEGLPFFLSLLYVTSRAANEIPELRQRMRADGIVEYDVCPTSHTVSLGGGRYCYCMLRADCPFDVYLPTAVEAQEAARREASMTESAADAESLFFVSTMPGIAFTSFVQPTPYPADSNPRFMFGKFFAAGDRILLPFSVQVNHALLGGQQLTAFFEALDRHIAAFGKGKSL